MMEKREAIEDNLPRLPGQSTFDTIIDIVLGQFLLPILFAMLAWSCLWNYFISANYLNFFYKVIILSWLTIISGLFITLRTLKIKKLVKSYQLGRKGEIYIGMYLAENKPKDFYIVHDLPFERFNIDHVIICQQGVFCIETKNWSKPLRGKTEIKVYDSHLEDGFGNKREQEITQCKAQKRSLETLIKQKIGQDIKVSPILVIINWYIIQTSKNPSVNVLNQKMMLNHIQRQPKVLDEKTVQYIYAQLRSI